MKKLIFMSLVALLCLASCSDNKKQQIRDDRHSEYLRPASRYYSHEDTVNIQQLVNQYVDLFKQNDFKGASQLLYKVRNDSVFPLSDAERGMFVRAMSSYHVYDARQQTLLLRSEKNNQVKLAVQIIEGGSIDEERGIQMFSLNPVLYEGQWYLTVLDSRAEGVEEVYRKEE